MIFAIFLICALVCQCQEPNLAITRDFESTLRSKNVPWEVASYEDNIFKGWTLTEIKHILGANNLKNHERAVPTTDADETMSVPDNFDGRHQWPKCFHSIRDQGQCGSCWAMALSEMMESRFCVQCNNKVVQLAPQDFVSCDKKDQGCDGGDFDPAIDYATQTGIVTDKCFPYVSGGGSVPRCITECKHKEEPYIKYKCKANTKKNYGPDRNAVKTAMYNSGPMAGGFRVYKDFLYYKGGIYMHMEGEYLGDHAIHTVGWGHSGGIDYWICQNSWGVNWGWMGSFNIRMGECDIDKDQWACDMECI